METTLNNPFWGGDLQLNLKCMDLMFDILTLTHYSPEKCLSELLKTLKFYKNVSYYIDD